jgi:dTMP kinase
MAKGKLIVLEGTDGAGKSTQLEFIKDYLKQRNLKFDYLHFPKYGHNEFSTVIAKFLQGDFGNVDEVNPYFVANIYAMDRFLFLPELNKMLEDNDVVLLDRYVFSGMAFQAGKYRDQEEANEIITWLDDFEFTFLDLPYPDLTLFLDVPIEVTKGRLKTKRKGKDRDYLEGKQDIHEADLKFQGRVRDAYIYMHDKIQYEDYYVVPCAKFVKGNGWIVYTPADLFSNYFNLIKDTIDGL